MFSRIVVALNDLPESQRALRTAIDLARSCNAELSRVSILGDPPAYASFSVVVDPGGPAAMMEQRRHRHEELHEKAANLARDWGVRAQGPIASGKEVHAILRFPKEQNADLLVVGLHQDDFCLSRLWNSVCDLAQDATCSVPRGH
jgi:nucleotide-binding universal stress UspA family protein